MALCGAGERQKSSGSFEEVEIPAGKGCSLQILGKPPSPSQRHLAGCKGEHNALPDGCTT